MANTGRNRTVAMAVVATLASAPAAWAAEPEATVVITVDNAAQAPAGTLADAEARATQIYAAAGIRTIWVNDATDSDVPATRHLTVVLLSRELAAEKAAADQLSDGVMGRAAHATGRAVVFYVRITDLARQGRCFVGNVLGKVLAHEVGHLLLPRPGHADRGIMQAGLDLTPDEERFTVVEANAMRGVLSSAQAAD